jgi:hypothetical protein
MTTIPAPALVNAREEWPDADFDLPDGVPLHAHCNRYNDIDEDWDVEMDLGTTGGAKVPVVASTPARLESSQSAAPRIMTIRPPLPQDDDDLDDEDEGLSTIKAAAFPKNIFKPAPQVAPVDDDIEAAFALPSDLSCLSLAPLSLNHRASKISLDSKNSLEWGDKDQTSSSQSSDAYSSLGFADASPSSNSVSSISLPSSETDDVDDDDEGELDGLVIPSGLFESGHGGRQLTKMLEKKKRAQTMDNQVKIATPDPEDNFEIGLIINDDVDLSPSRLLTAQQQQSQRGPISRSYSMPPRPGTLRPPSRLRGERAKSPNHPPPSSARHFNKLRLSPSPPLRTVTQAQTFQALASPAPTPPVSFLTPKPATLRNQKSHSGLKPPTPPATQRKLTRKASLSSLMEVSQTQASGSGSAFATGSLSKLTNYEAPTAASKAKSHKKSSTCLSQEFNASTPTPSSNPALRLTMPTLSRTKSRPGLSAVFSAGPSSAPPLPCPSVPSPPSRPPSNASIRTRVMQPPPSSSQSAVPKVLRKPKRPRTYGDGTELDAIADLPTDREKEGLFRVQPKGYGNRVPGGSYSAKTIERNLKKGKRKVSSESTGVYYILSSVLTFI